MRWWPRKYWGLLVMDNMSYTHMLILRPCENGECPKQAVIISLYASHTTHAWTCEGDSGSSWSYWCLCTILVAQLLTLTLLPLYIYSVEIAAGVSVPVKTQPSSSFADVGLTLTFCTWEHSFVYTCELPLSSRNMSYIKKEGQVYGIF